MFQVERNQMKNNSVIIEMMQVTHQRHVITEKWKMWFRQPEKWKM